MGMAINNKFLHIVKTTNQRNAEKAFAIEPACDVATLAKPDRWCRPNKKPIEKQLAICRAWPYCQQTWQGKER